MGIIVTASLRKPIELSRHLDLLISAEQVGDMERYRELLREPVDPVVVFAFSGSVSAEFGTFGLIGLERESRAQVIELPIQHKHHNDERKERVRKIDTQDDTPEYRRLEYRRGPRRSDIKRGRR